MTPAHPHSQTKWRPPTATSKNHNFHTQQLADIITPTLVLQDHAIPTRRNSQTLRLSQTAFPTHGDSNTPQLPCVERFLVACTQLYKTLCWSVRRSMSSNFWSRISLFRSLQRLSTAPAQPHATEIAVYTALFFFLFSLFAKIAVYWESIRSQPFSLTISIDRVR